LAHAGNDRDAAGAALRSDRGNRRCLRAVLAAGDAGGSPRPGLRGRAGGGRAHRPHPDVHLSALLLRTDRRLLRSPGSERGLRPRSPGRHAPDRLTSAAMVIQGDPGTATLRAVLDTVFAASGYRWADEPAPWRFLRSWWHRLAEWLQGLRADNPAVFRLLLLSVLAAL